MHAATPTRRVPLSTVSRIASALVVAALFLTDGVLAARQFDTWYLARSIVREDTSNRCPIDTTSVWTGALDPAC